MDRSISSELFVGIDQILNKQELYQPEDGGSSHAFATSNLQHQKTYSSFPSSTSVPEIHLAATLEDSHWRIQ